MTGIYTAGALIGGSLISGLFGKSSAKTQAAAAAQDQRQTGVSNEFFKQLQQSLSQMDKSVVEKMFGTSNTADVMQQLQTMQQEQQTTGQANTDQTQTTVRGDSGANQAVLGNILKLSEQFGTGGEDVMNATINKVLRSGAGAIAGVGNRSGTFGDTTTALLQNDLVTRASEAGVLAESARQGQMSNSLAQLMQSLQAGTETTTGKQATTNKEGVVTSGTNNTTGTNTSNTTTTQDRTANEKATESNATSNTGSNTTVSDTLTDFAKDGSIGMGSKNASLLPSLGQNIGTAPAAPTNSLNPADPNALAGVDLSGLLPKAPGSAPQTLPVMGGQQQAPTAQATAQPMASGQPVAVANAAPAVQPSPLAGIALPGGGMPNPEQLAALGLTPEQLAQLQAGTPSMTTGVWNPPKAATM